jgi:cyanophycinase
LRPANSKEDQRGLLVLIGGRCSPTGAALAAFITAVRERGGPIVGITAASADPAGSGRMWNADFASVGVTDIAFPEIIHGNKQNDSALAACIDDAAGVFLGGGDQVKLVTELSGTKSEAALKRLFARGGVVCGTSAGAAALTALTMAGGEIDDEGQLVEQYIGPGFGLLGFEAIVDTHFSARRRLQRLFSVIVSRPNLLGLGIDEDTALVVRNGVGRVVGMGGVTFVDGRDTVRFDNSAELEKGRQLTFSHLRVGVVGTDFELNLERRELEVVVRRANEPA